MAAQPKQCELEAALYPTSREVDLKLADVFHKVTCTRPEPEPARAL